MLGSPPVYRIELRIRLSRYRLDRLNEQVSLDFGVPVEKVPHLTLFGPFHLKPGITESLLKEALERPVRDLNVIPFIVYGFERRKGGDGDLIAHHVVPGSPLAGLKRLFVRELNDLVISAEPGDMDPAENRFHVAIARRLTRERSDLIWNRISCEGAAEEDLRDPSRLPLLALRMQKYLSGGFRAESPGIRKIYPLFVGEDILRLTIAKGQGILAEYDLPGKRWLTRPAALSPVRWATTLREYRKGTGLELERPAYHTGETFFIGDTHFGHRNIIRSCGRPFEYTAVREMDDVLTRNWNYTVRPEDPVVFLGDLAYGRGPRNPFSYLQHLNGKIRLIRGDHDDEAFLPRMENSFEFTHRGIRFLCIHDPRQADPDFNGWIVHGHIHNNNPQEYPFINPHTRTINVSAELTGYRPVSLSSIYVAVTRIPEACVGPD